MPYINMDLFDALVQEKHEEDHVPVLPVSQRPLSQLWVNDVIDGSPGRRMRVFAACTALGFTTPEKPYIYFRSLPFMRFHFDSTTIPTFKEMLNEIMKRDWKTWGIHHILSHHPVYGQQSTGMDLELVVGLQDLADEINSDITEACEAFDNPDIIYSRPPEGSIDPVSNDLIDRVIPALQRELNRETRAPDRMRFNPFVQKLPAAPLKDLPDRIKRALVERRRYRYLQYGIKNSNIKENSFSIFDIKEDSEFVPRIQTKKYQKLGKQNPFI